MSVVSVIFHEIRHSAIGFLLGLVAVTIAVTLLIALTLTGRASYTETKQLMRNLGFNVLVLPAEANLNSYWVTHEVEGQMPEEYVTKLANTRGLSADHYVATLQERIKWRDTQVLLRGVLREQTAIGARKKRPMGTVVPKGKALLGAALADRYGLKTGDVITIRDRELQIADVPIGQGSEKDIMVYTHLDDAQQMLDMPDRINMIQLLHCLCHGPNFEPVRKKITNTLANTQVAQLQNIAEARAETRQMIKKYSGLIASTIVVISMGWIGLLALLNVKQRRGEIGLLRAMGFGSWRVGAIFITRTALMGLFGAIIGFGLGNWVGLHYGPDIFRITVSKLKPAWDLFVPTLAGATVISIIAGLLPMLLAIMQDPAAILMEE